MHDSHSSTRIAIYVSIEKALEGEIPMDHYSALWWFRGRVLERLQNQLDKAQKLDIVVKGEV
jgi:hypothetical protein